MPKQRQHILSTYIKTLKVGPVKGWTVDLLLYNMN